MYGYIPLFPLKSIILRSTYVYDHIIPDYIYTYTQPTQTPASFHSPLSPPQKINKSNTNKNTKTKTN